MERKEVIKMFKDIGCKECCMLRDDPESIIPGLLNATNVVIDIKVILKSGVELIIFCQGVLDFTSDDYAGFKDCLIKSYEDIERIEFGQLGSFAIKND